MYQGNSANRRPQGGRPQFKRGPAHRGSRPSFTSVPGSSAPARPSYGGSRPSFRSSKSHFKGGGGNRSSFNRGGRGGNRRNAPTGEHIDVSRFINKAVITESSPVYQPAHAFNDFNLDNRLKHNITSHGYAS